MTSISQQLDRHNAARDKIAREIYHTMVWTACHAPASVWGDKDIIRMQQQARKTADKVLSDIYASGVAASVKEAARVLLAADDYMPTPARIAAVKAHTMRAGKVRPVAVAEGWRAALLALVEQDAPE